MSDLRANACRSALTAFAAKLRAYSLPQIVPREEAMRELAELWGTLWRHLRQCWCHLEQTQCLGIPTNYGNGAKLPRVERKFKLKLKENYKMERSFRALSGSSSSSAYSWTSNNLDRKWSDAHSEGRTSSSS
ncbi:unnamed protein product [Prorocentrum cordatum]|uniref:Uncharacterized protein n=1 Tax=Prorocentrum cordatum TaxID=2364126 RepID=A0ABN9WAF7_9DINO|nr:unnamed protein product [Polarella glacialis]